MTNKQNTGQSPSQIRDQKDISGTSKSDATNESVQNIVSGKKTPEPTNQVDEIATNDGSVIETLDTAFHGKPGWSEGENPSGSNRADYYEARSNGKSDVEEEVEELKKGNVNK